MSSSTATYSNQPPADVPIIEPPPDILNLLERTASLVARKGLKMERTIMNFNKKTDKRFNFLQKSDPCHAFYHKKLSEYRAQNPDGAVQDDIQPDAPATRKRVRVPLPPPYSHPPTHLAPYRFALIKPPEEIILKELCIIKLTAQFAARYGMYFLADLIKREAMNPLFYFMKEPDTRSYDYFTKLVVAYSRVLNRSKKHSKRRACMETVLERFFEHLRVEKLEEGSKMAINDLQALVGGVDCFLHMEVEGSSAKVHRSMLMTQMQPAGGLPVTPPLQPNCQLPRLSIEDRFLFPPKHSEKLSSTSRQNGLQSGQNIPNQALAQAAIIEPLLSKRCKVERTALLVSQEGLEIEKRIRDCNVGNRRFNFLRTSDPCHAFYQKKLTEYRALIQDGVQPDAPASPPRGLFKLDPVNIEPPEGITLRELVIMKFTAQFAARYGICFTVEVEKRVTGSPLFEFLEKRRYADSSFFTELVCTYSRVLRRSEDLCKWRASDMVLNCFFEKLQLEKQEEGVEMALRDVQAFVGVVDHFAHMEKEELDESALAVEGLNIN